MNNNKNSQKGFTILVAVITAGILLIIAMSIGGIALKEQVLATANKESQVAFYAADTGMECALYWDQKQGAFAPDDDGNASTTIPTITCGGVAATSQLGTMQLNPIITAPPSNLNDAHAEYSYSFMVSHIPVGDIASHVYTCAVVTVTKDTNDDDPSVCPGQLDSCVFNTHTTIQSYGYNTCEASLSRLERGIISSN